MYCKTTGNVGVKVITIDQSGSIPQTLLPDFGTGDFTMEFFVKLPIEAEHDKVVRILKGGFEKSFGMSFERFLEVYREIVKNHPEKLI